jgi:hypothetical protein
MLAMLLLLLTVGGALFIITRSWFISGRVTPALAEALGGDVTIGAVGWRGGGRFILRDVTLRSREHAGPAAEVLAIGEASVRVDPWKLLAGHVRLQRIEVADARLRLSEDAHESGQYSFMGLRPEWTGDLHDDRLAPPGITIHDVLLEFGVHDGSQYQKLGTWFVAGRMTPSFAGETCTFELHEIIGRDQPTTGGLDITGTWDVVTNEVNGSIARLVIDEDRRAIAPRAIRFWLDEMDLLGSVSHATIAWLQDQPPQATLTLADVRLTLPDPSEVWVRYQHGIVGHSRPRMHVQSGTIKLEEDEFVLEALQGTLGNVPYLVNLTVGDLPEMDWGTGEALLEYALNVAPFTMEVTMPEDFRIGNGNGGGDGGPVDLPRPIAELFERFGITDWAFSATIDLSREEPIWDEGRPVPRDVEHRGTVAVTDGSGKYAAFPYRLHNIVATARFSNEGLILDELRGDGFGEGAAQVVLRGHMTPVSPPAVGGAHEADEEFLTAVAWRDAEIDLYLTAGGLALDEHFHSALNDAERMVFDGLMHAPFEQSLRQAGMLPFMIGGNVDLDLRIRREPGPRMPTRITGAVKINEAGLLLRDFPYPLWITSGALRWEHDGIVIDESEPGRGAEFVTPGGGRGILTGRLSRLGAGATGRLVPDLTLSVRGDSLTEHVYLAIPLSHAESDEKAEHWPGGEVASAAEVLRSMGLSGSLDYDGRIFTTGNGEVDYEVAVRLAGGVARPGRSFAESLGAGGLPWPDGAELEAVRAELRVRRGAVEVLTFDAVRGEAHISAVGSIELGEEPNAVSLDVRFAGLPLSEYLIELVPGDHAPRMRELWREMQPAGTLDAEVSYRASGGKVEPLHISIEPLRAGIVIGGERVDVEGVFDAHVRQGRYGADALIDDGELEFVVRPRSLAMTVGEHVLAAELDEGSRIVFAPGRMDLIELRGRHTHGSFSLDGQVRHEDLIDVELRMEHTGALRSPAVLVLLPKPLEELLEQVAFQDGGATAVRDGELRLAQTAAGNWRSQFKGTIILDGASFQTGVDFTDARGEVNLHVEHEPGHTPQIHELSARLDSLRLLNRAVTHVRVPAITLSSDGLAVHVPEMRGDMHGGAIWAEATVGVGANRTYQVAMEVVGVSLGPLVNEQAVEGRRAAAARLPDGEVFGEFRLAGERGDDASRRGRGMIRALGGNLAAVPLVLQVMNVVKLIAPLRDSFDNAQAEFYIDGERVVFERILLESTLGNLTTLDLQGEGWMTLPATELHARFRSRGGMILLRDIAGGLGDQLYAIEVYGTLGHPQARIVPLPMLSHPSLGGGPAVINVRSGNAALSAAQEP